MQDRLNELVLRGEKVATAGLRQYDYIDDDEALDAVGEVQVLLDGEGRAVAEIEVTRVEVHLFALVPWEFAQAEGEGFTSIEHWRDAHENSTPRRASRSSTTTSSCASGSAWRGSSRPGSPARQTPV